MIKTITVVNGTKTKVLKVPEKWQSMVLVDTINRDHYNNRFIEIIETVCNTGHINVFNDITIDSILRVFSPKILLNSIVNINKYSIYSMLLFTLGPEMAMERQYFAYSYELFQKYLIQYFPDDLAKIFEFTSLDDQQNDSKKIKPSNKYFWSLFRRIMKGHEEHIAKTLSYGDRHVFTKVYRVMYDLIEN